MISFCVSSFSFCFSMMSFCFSFLTFLFRHPFLHFDIAPSLVGRKTPAFSFSSPAKVEIRANSKQKLPVKLIFSVQNEISGEKILRVEEKNIPKKVDFAPKVTESNEKGRFGVRNRREGIERKNGLYCRFCHAMK